MPGFCVQFRPPKQQVVGLQGMTGSNTGWDEAFWKQMNLQESRTKTIIAVRRGWGSVPAEKGTNFSICCGVQTSRIMVRFGVGIAWQLALLNYTIIVPFYTSFLGSYIHVRVSKRLHVLMFKKQIPNMCLCLYLKPQLCQGHFWGQWL